MKHPVVGAVRHILRHSERLARWALAVATYHVEPNYVERGRRLYPLLFADAVVRAIRRAQVSRAFDVGAHFGEFGRALRRAGYDGPIDSFEPNPDAVRILSAHVRRDTAWRVHDYALGRETADAHLHRPRSSEFASLRTALPYGGERWGDRVMPHEAVSVRVQRLDDVLPSVLPTGEEANGGGPLLLKIDTQGSDLDVLDGATRTLPFVAVLVMELSLIPLYEGAPHFLDALRYVESEGFSIASLVPVTHDTATGVPIELDACLVRTPLAARRRQNTFTQVGLSHPSPTPPRSRSAALSS